MAWAAAGFIVTYTVCPVSHGFQWRWYPPAMFQKMTVLFANQVAAGIPFGWEGRQTGTLASGGGESWG